MEVSNDDLKSVAPMALRLRRSPFMTEYIQNQQGEEEELDTLLSALEKKRGKKAKSLSQK